MSEFAAALLAALWLGILTSLSPCPMATNVAAISFVARRVKRPRQVLLAGVLYTIGRSLTYAILGVILAASILSAPVLSQFLQKYMNKVLGPLLILVGMVLLDLLLINTRGRGVSHKFQEKMDSWGLWSALPLGALFAASFCPISAALFFGSLLTTALRVESTLLLPVVYGVGTALPVTLFALLIAWSSRSLGGAFNSLAAFDRWARRITGGIFIQVGIYYSLRYVFNLF